MNSVVTINVLKLSNLHCAKVKGNCVGFAKIMYSYDIGYVALETSTEKYQKMSKNVYGIDFNIVLQD